MDVSLVRKQFEFFLEASKSSLAEPAEWGRGKLATDGCTRIFVTVVVIVMVFTFSLFPHLPGEGC